MPSTVTQPFVRLNKFFPQCLLSSAEVLQFPFQAWKRASFAGRGESSVNRWEPRTHFYRKSCWLRSNGAAAANKDFERIYISPRGEAWSSVHGLRVECAGEVISSV